MIDGDRLATDMLNEMRGLWHVLVIEKNTPMAAQRISLSIRSLVWLQTGRYTTIVQARTAARNEELQALRQRSED